MALVVVRSYQIESTQARSKKAACASLCPQVSKASLAERGNPTTGTQNSGPKAYSRGQPDFFLMIRTSLSPDLSDTHIAVVSTSSNVSSHASLIVAR